MRTALTVDVLVLVPLSAIFVASGTIRSGFSSTTSRLLQQWELPVESMLEREPGEQRVVPECDDVGGSSEVAAILSTVRLSGRCSTSDGSGSALSSGIGWSYALLSVVSDCAFRVNCERELLALTSAQYDSSPLDVPSSPAAAAASNDAETSPRKYLWCRSASTDARFFPAASTSSKSFFVVCSLLRCSASANRNASTTTTELYTWGERCHWTEHITTPPPYWRYI